MPTWMLVLSRVFGWLLTVDGRDARSVVRMARRVEGRSAIVGRRRWFDSDGDGEGEGEPDGDPPGGRDADQDWSSLPGWAREQYESLQARLKEVNQESASRRHKLSEYEQRLESLEAQRRKGMSAEEKAAELEKELNSLKQYQDRAADLEKLIQESNERRIEQLPEDRRGLIPTEELSPDAVAAYLDRNWQYLTKAPAPGLDGGAGGGGKSPSAGLTDEDRENARKAGMTLEEWAKAKKRAGL